MKRICAIIAAVLLFMGCAAAAEEIQYELKSGEVVITGYTGDEAVLILPETIESAPVTAIADGAFKGNAIIASVTIPQSIARIGAGAFIGCDTLTEVIIENNDCEIGMFAFEACSDAMVICAASGSAAEAYALENSMEFVSTGTDERARAYLDAKSALEAGDLNAALIGFGSLGAYAESQKYYMYVTARMDEENGNTDFADAIYSALGDFLDSAERAKADAYIGGKKVTLPDPTQAPVSGALAAYQDFSGKMPYEFEDRSKTTGYYALYFNISGAEDVDSYVTAFTDAGWTVNVQDGGEWVYKYVVTPDGNTFFYTGINAKGGVAVFVYSSESDYGFDPINGLY